MKQPRRILLVAAGLTPQVVTETVYALAVDRQPPWIPGEIWLVTTREGANRARLALLSREPGWFHRLRREHDLPPITFTDAQIVVIAAPDGRQLDDLITAEDHQTAADVIVELIRRFTEDSKTELHVSLAGGRKTMGFFLGYALSLYGRDQDRLSHVLVDPPYETNVNFFYPTRETHIIYTHPPELRPLDASQARVRLAEIPFVRLRSKLPPDQLEHAASFGAVVAAAQRGLADPRLSIRLVDLTVQAGDVTLRMPPADLAFYAMIADRAGKGLPPCECPSDGAPDGDLASAYLRFYRGRHREQSLKTLRDGMTKSFFLERRSRINAALDAALGVRSQAYQIITKGRRPRTVYTLGLAAEQIEIHDPEGKQS